MMKEILEWVKTIALALVIAAIISVFARPSLVIGPSMEPTLQSYDLLLMERVTLLTQLPNRGDIIIFKSELKLNSFMKKNLIKRVIGVAGDHIQILGGEVYLNDKLLEEPYITPITTGNVDVVVPEDSVFVLGDNRPNSTDSRFDTVSFVNKSQIKGKAYIRLFPFNNITLF